MYGVNNETSHLDSLYHHDVLTIYFSDILSSTIMLPGNMWSPLRGRKRREQKGMLRQDEEKAMAEANRRKASREKAKKRRWLREREAAARKNKSDMLDEENTAKGINLYNGALLSRPLVRLIPISIRVVSVFPCVVAIFSGLVPFVHCVSFKSHPAVNNNLQPAFASASQIDPEHKCKAVLKGSITGTLNNSLNRN